jgi:hypothetical protein
MDRLVTERLDVRLAFGHVADTVDGERPVSDLHLAGFHLDREARAVLAPTHRPDQARCRLRPGAPTRGRHGCLRDIVLLTHSHDQPHRLPDRLLLGVTEQPARRTIKRFDQAVLVDRHDPVNDVLQYRMRPCLTLVQRRVEDGDRLKRTLKLLRLDEQIDIRRDL